MFLICEGLSSKYCNIESAGAVCNQTRKSCLSTEACGVLFQAQEIMPFIGQMSLGPWYNQYLNAKSVFGEAVCGSMVSVVVDVGPRFVLTVSVNLMLSFPLRGVSTVPSFFIGIAIIQPFLWGDSGSG